MIEINNTPQTSMDLLRMILVDQMCLDPDRVNIYDEKWKIPSIDDLFIVLEYRRGKCIGNRNTFISTGGEPEEHQNLNMLEDITIGVFSRNRSATQRKEEVLLAIMSSYAQSLQEAYAFKIARAGIIQDLSELEGSAMLKRYDIEVRVFAWYKKIITPNYISPPYILKIYANDPGDGIIKTQVTQLESLPN